MAGRNKKKIDPRKSIFISEILTGKNGAESARAAGIEKRNAARQASRWQKEPEVAAEIEQGLAAIRQGAEVDVQSMIKQLDADRLFGIKTENASAATRASELKAKLCGLMIDRRDVRAAHVVKAEDYKTKDVALAINALLQDSDLAVIKRNSDPSSGDTVAALESGASSVGSSASDASPDIAMVDPPEKIGVQISIGNRGAKIVPVETASGVRKYAIYDFADELHSFKFDRLAAEELSRTLPGIPEHGTRSE